MRTFILGLGFVIMMAAIRAFLDISLLASFFITCAICFFLMFVRGFREGYAEKSKAEASEAE